MHDRRAFRVSLADAVEVKAPVSFLRRKIACNGGSWAAQRTVERHFPRRYSGDWVTYDVFVWLRFRINT